MDILNNCSLFTSQMVSQLSSDQALGEPRRTQQDFIVNLRIRPFTWDYTIRKLAEHLKTKWI